MNAAKSFETIQSKLIICVAVLSAATAISLAFHPAGTAKNNDVAIYLPVQQIVVEAKRMTPEEKLLYDASSQVIARVEIVGKRLSADEKLAMLAEEQLDARQSVQHRKV